MEVAVIYQAVYKGGSSFSHCFFNMFYFLRRIEMYFDWECMKQTRTVHFVISSSRGGIFCFFGNQTLLPKKGYDRSENR